MALAPAPKPRPQGLLALTVALTAISGMLALLLWLVLSTAELASPELKPAMTRLAWIALATLAFTLVLLVWVAIRFIARLSSKQHHPPTRYVDAWSLAGERFELDKTAPEDEEDEDDDDAFDEEDDEGETPRDDGNDQPRK